MPTRATAVRTTTPGPLGGLPPDTRLSPWTGLTREHWVAVADDLLLATRAHMSPSGARVEPPGPTSWSGPGSDALEGYARSFLLLSYRMAGTDGAAPRGLLDAYASGLAAGTDPAHPEAWPALDQRTRQTLVEACSIVLALHHTRAWIWDGLDPAVQDRVVSWLQGVHGLELPDNNWHWFRVVVAEFLGSVGAVPGACERAEVEQDLDRLEEMWVGDGWYRDGAGGGDRFDHYCGWAMHHYPVMWARLAGENSPVTGARAAQSLPVARERLHRFLQDYGHTVGGDGAPLHQGRSLIYRWAAATAPLLGSLADATPLSPGATRHLASGMLRHFVDRGALGPDGLPTLGWYGPFPAMVQPYSAPASPLWSAKAFLGLLLPADHALWTAVEEPLPVEGPAVVRGLVAPGFVLSTTPEDGIARISNHGSDNWFDGVVDDPHYSRLAYSTVTGPMLGTAAERSPDNHVGLVSPGGRLSRRGRIHRGVVSADRASSRHVPTWWDADGAPAPQERSRTIETWSVRSGPWELRAHLVDDPDGLDVRDSGWALAGTTDGDHAVAASSGDGWVLLERADGLTSVLVGLHGYDAQQVDVVEGANAFGPTAWAPALRGRRAGRRTAHVSLVGLGHGLAVPVEPVCAVTPGEHGGVRVVAVLPDGERHAVLLGGPDTPFGR
jgi:hypothetical protein